MRNTPEGMRLCPTRADAAPVLFAHVIGRSTCQDRQRGHYHKCYSCLHNNVQPAPVPPAPRLPGREVESTPHELVDAERVQLRAV